MTAQEIRSLREQLGRNQKDMAALVDVSPLTWSRWEAGKFAPLPIYRKKLAKLLLFVQGRKG